MSHNTYTINNVGANVVSYHGANKGIIYIGRGESAAYGGSFANNEVYEWYDSDPVNTITGASFTTVSRASGTWIQKITLPAGTYHIEAYSLVPISNASIAYMPMVLRQDVGGTETGRVKGAWYAENAASVNGVQYNLLDISHDLAVLTATTTIFWRFIVQVSGTTVSDTGQRISTTNTLFIRKLA